MIAVKARTAEPKIIYDGVPLDLANDAKSFQYVDESSGNSDTISLEIADISRKWITVNYPKKGAKMAASIVVRNWLSPGDTRILHCGSFTLDDVGFSGWPLSASLSAVSAPSDSSFRETKRTKTWENATVQQIAAEISGKYGLLCIYEADESQVDTKEQNEQTDSEFLTSLCADYGLCIKIYDTRVVIYDREMVKKMPPVAVFTQADILPGWSFQTSLDGTYTGGKITYTDADSEEDIEVTVGTDERLLELNEKCDSEADAEKKIKSAVNEANHDMTKLHFKTMGNPALVSTQNVQISGMGEIDGKYYLNKVTHDLSASGYVTTYDASKVEETVF